MSKREKVILIVAALALLYGAYDFIFHKNKTRNNLKKTVDVQKVQKDILSTLAKNHLTKNEKIIESLLNAKIKDPFIYKKVEKSITNKKDTQITNLIYSGFVMLGDKKVAIINNKEYQEGDELDIKNYLVWQIFDTKVVLKGPGKDNFVTLPLIDFLKIH